uniref:CCHC-type domain-containing protein n=1 Tax=Leersia perrieri TaxID=77586 RepID=A0A0D9XM33_9ORYZ
MSGELWMTTTGSASSFFFLDQVSRFSSSFLIPNSQSTPESRAVAVAAGDFHGRNLAAVRLTRLLVLLAPADLPMICATIVSAQDILLETVQMWLSAMPVGFQGTLQQSVRPKISAGTAKSLATWLAAARMKGYAVTVASQVTLQETALLHHRCQRGGPPPFRGGGPPPFRGGYSDVVCRACNQVGHMSRDCMAGAFMICHNCGGRGHMAYECPSGRLMDRFPPRRY